MNAKKLLAAVAILVVAAAMAAFAGVAIAEGARVLAAPPPALVRFMDPWTWYAAIDPQAAFASMP